MFKFDFDIEQEEPAQAPVTHAVKSIPEEVESLEEFSEISLDYLLDALPSLMSHSPLHIPLASKENLALARRDLFDARFQLIAEGLDPQGEDSVTAINFLDAPSDLVPGLYEGGLKTWECSLDLVHYLDGTKEEADWSGKQIIEIGCGTAVPSLYILKEIFSSPPSSDRKETHIHLQDYNKSVLELVTFPNVLLAWYMSPASLAYRQSESRDKPSQQPPAPSKDAPEALNPISEEEEDASPAIPELVMDEADPREPGELTITPGLVAAFRTSLQTYRIHLRFFSGSWETLTSAITNKKLGSVSEPHDVVLTSETIYRPKSLSPLVELLQASCGRSPSDTLDVSRLSLREGAQPPLCLVAAKVLYFGVGGGVSEFLRTVEKKAKVEHVWERSVGVGRKILRVQWN